MKTDVKAARTAALAVLITLLAVLCPSLAAAEPKTAADPFAGALFPPELVLMARNQIALSPEQQEALRARIEQAKPRSDELRTRLERETALLATLAKQERVDEKSLIAQLDKVLDAERELKHLHVGLAVSIKNLLTPEQQAKLREIAKDGGAKLAEDTRKRLSEKVERVKEGAENWAASGHDPSAILKMMDEKVKPLLEAGKPIEAEAELDRVLDQLKQDSK